MVEFLKRRSPARFGLFFHFLSRHLAVLAIIAAIGIPLYVLIISDVRKNEIQNRSERLNLFKNQLENQFRAIDELMFNLAWSTEMNQILTVDKLITRTPPADKRATYVAVSSAIGSLAGGLGVIVAGLLLQIVQAVDLPALEWSQGGFRIIFFLSLLLRSAAAHILIPRIRE